MANAIKDNIKVFNILLGVTGSVAAIKAPELAVRLSRELGANVKILLTAGARNFWEQSQDYNEHWWNELRLELENTDSTRVEDTKDSSDDQARLSNGKADREGKRNTVQVLFSEDEWRCWNKIGDPILHIDLRDWADCLVIAPLSAHTLGKMANGLCDDALSSVARAWDIPRKPMVLAPAMNTFMWEHPLTRNQLETIKGFYPKRDEANNTPIMSAETTTQCLVVQPQVKTLACGQVGNGALAPIADILNAVRTVLPKP